MARGDARIEHLLRRAAFGATDEELQAYSHLGYAAALDRLLNYESVADVVDSHIGQPGYVGVTARGQFLPNTVIADSRQRWLFRMVHSQRPLQEKMTLFWHHHFATAYSKIAGVYGSEIGARMMAAKASEDGGRVQGQLELLREHALGNFRDMLVAIAKDPAMLVWLDGRLNTRTRPQENFGRELMELFSVGVEYYTEPDVYAAARVFTGWNLRRNTGPDGVAKYDFYYDANQHDTAAKTFSFPIYADGGKTIPARSAADGQQDGLDLIDAVARHFATPRRLARKLFAFFVSELEEPSENFLQRISGVYYGSRYDMGAVVRAVLTSPEFEASSSYYARYSWPVEFVVRAIKEVGWVGFSVNDTLTPLSNMGQQLYEPPDVNGWEVGKGWFSTGGSLARMNFASTLATNQRFALRDAARVANKTPESVVSWSLLRLTPATMERGPVANLEAYANAGISNWTGSDAQLLLKAPGLVHLIAASSEYQLV